MAMTTQTKHEAGGKAITIWVQKDKVDEIDAVCQSANCSRSWLFAQMLAVYDFSELGSEANK
jgi:hypothetical protein